jgi:hypothetical protein
MGWKRQPGLPSPEPKRDGGQRAALSSEMDEDQTGWVSAIKVAGAGPSVWGASLDCTWISTGYSAIAASVLGIPYSYHPLISRMTAPCPQTGCSPSENSNSQPRSVAQHSMSEGAAAVTKHSTPVKWGEWTCRSTGHLLATPPHLTSLPKPEPEPGARTRANRVWCGSASGSEQMTSQAKRWAARAATRRKQRQNNTETTANRDHRICDCGHRASRASPASTPTTLHRL